MTTYPPLNAKFRAIAILLLALSPVFSPAINAQDDEDYIVELSPFIVDSSEDQGYVATNTLAGTRLNAPLRTTPATISVFTAEFLADTASDDIMEAIEYSVNFTGESTPGDNGNAFQDSSINVRARGFPRSSFASRDFIRNFVSQDSYNSERFTFSSGPNSVLFGVGNPGGIINSVTKRALFGRDKTTFSARADTFGSVRGTMDISRELVKDKLAVRINGLFDHERFARENEYEDQERWHIAASWKPFASTELRVDYETGEMDRLRQRRWTVRDQFTEWDGQGIDLRDWLNGAGQVDWNSLRTFVNATDGITFFNGDTPAYFQALDGTITPGNLRGQIWSTGDNRPLKQFDVFDKETGAVLTNTSDNWLETYSVSLEQRFGENLFFEVTYNKQEDKREALRNINHADISARQDVIEYFADGTPNPNFGGNGVFLMRGNSMFAGDPSEGRTGETFRTTGSYTWDPENKWLGRHSFAALYQTEEFDTGAGGQFFVVNRSVLNPNRLTITQNRVNTVSYFDPTGQLGPSGYHFQTIDNLTLNPSLQPYQLFNPTTGAEIGPVTPDLVQRRLRPRREEITSQMIAGQSLFWDGKFAFTWGLREDELDNTGFAETTVSRDAARESQANDPVGEGLIQGEIITGTLGDTDSFSGDTETLGAAFTPFRWLTLTANQSNNFSPQSGFDIRNNQVGNIVGEGEDYSVRLSLLEDKVYAVMTYYETSVRNDANNAFFEFTRINRIWESLESHGVVSNPTLVIEGANTLEDFDADGYEFEIVASPTRNITLRFNYTNADNVQGEVNPVLNDYYNEFVPVWNQYRDLPEEVGNTDPGANTIGDIVDVLTEDNDSARRAIGVGSRGHMSERFNFFGKYAFNDGMLQGLDIGWGIRYRGEANLEFRLVNDEIVEDLRPDFMLHDFMLGYRTKIGDNIRVRLQLNVKNVFEEDDIIITRAFGDGSPRDYNLQEPRRIQFSTSFDF